MVSICVLFALMAPASPARAGGDAAASAHRFYIQAIHIQGLERTEPFVIYRELLVAKGDSASKARIEESIQRVRNTGLFRKVTYKLVDTPGQHPVSSLPEGVSPVTLEIHIDERWTALPLLTFARGGGTYRLVVGAFDDNFLGRDIGIGAQYERLGSTNSFYGWAFNPRLFDQRLRAGIDVGSRNRTYTLYDQDGAVDGGFLLRRFTVGVYAQKEWLWWLRTKVGLRYNNDSFSYELLSDSLRSLQKQHGLPPPTQQLLGSVTGLLGRIDQDNYLVDGTLFSLSLEHANAALGSSQTMTDVLVGLSHFERFPLKINVGARLAGAVGDINAVQDRFYLGGLDGIRGFASDRFSGQSYWLGNFEFRIPSVDTRWLVLQHVVFVDAAGVSESLSGLATLSGASVGIGLRVIVPKIHDFVARFDYAFPLYGDTTTPLSFGGGQFF